MEALWCSLSETDWPILDPSRSPCEDKYHHLALSSVVYITNFPISFLVCSVLIIFC